MAIQPPHSKTTLLVAIQPPLFNLLTFSSFPSSRAICLGLRTYLSCLNLGTSLLQSSSSSSFLAFFFGGPATNFLHFLLFSKAAKLSNNAFLLSSFLLPLLMAFSIFSGRPALLSGQGSGFSIHPCSQLCLSYPTSPPARHLHPCKVLP